VSSFLKTILGVVFVALWIGVAIAALLLLAAVLLSFNPGLISGVARSEAGSELAARGPVLAGGLLAGGLYMAGVLVIVGTLRRIFATLTAGDPFHPDNVTRLRLIGLLLVGLELGRYLVAGLGAWLLPGADSVDPSLNLTGWFSILVVFVLAEVFREGARLRREAELTI
jgi:hypothetical protein